jgi:hypothetical protein
MAKYSLRQQDILYHLRNFQNTIMVMSGNLRRKENPWSLGDEDLENLEVAMEYLTEKLSHISEISPDHLDDFYKEMKVFMGLSVYQLAEKSQSLK